MSERALKFVIEHSIAELLLRCSFTRQWRTVHCDRWSSVIRILLEYISDQHHWWKIDRIALHSNPNDARTILLQKFYFIAVFFAKTRNTRCTYETRNRRGSEARVKAAELRMSRCVAPDLNRFDDTSTTMMS